MSRLYYLALNIPGLLLVQNHVISIWFLPSSVQYDINGNEAGESEKIIKVNEKSYLKTFPDTISSMKINTPTIQHNWTIGLYYKFGLQYFGKTSVKVGDYVCYTSPVDPKIHLTGKVIAVEKDVVYPLAAYKQHSLRIPIAHCWIESDDSLDSNIFGPVSISLVDSVIVWNSREGMIKRTLTPSQLDRVILRGFMNR